MTTGNPFSRALFGWLPPRARGADRAAFLEHWDALEALVIAVYRAGAARPPDEADYAAIAGWFAEAYPRFRTALAAHWPATRAAGEPVTSDPFAALLGRPSAAAFVGDWAAMQQLPAAREALNRWLLGAGDTTRPTTPT